MKKGFSEKDKGVFSIILLGFVFACMGIFARYLSAEFTILQQTYLRIAAAFGLGFFIFIKYLHFEKLKKITLKEWTVLTFRSIALYLIGVTFVSEAFVTAKFSNASFISSLPVTAVFGFLLLREKVSIAKIVYLLLGFAGVVLIAVKDYSHLFEWGHGEVFAFFSAIFFALSYIARKWQSNLLNNQEIAVIIFFISSVLLFVTSLLFGEGLPHAGNFTNFMIFIIIVAALFNVANLYLTNYGFQKVPAVLASNLLMSQVVFALFISMLFYQEIPTLKEFLGGVLIVFSAYQMNKITD